MKRLIFVGLAFLVGCNGMGGGASRFLPAGPGPSSDAPASAPAAAEMPQARRGPKTKVRLTMTIPKRHRGAHLRAEHPSTISPLTESVSIAINGGGAHVFNATPSSAACHIGPTGTVCSFLLDAPVGSDTFVVATYSGPSGGGAKLDQGSAVFNVVRGKSNTPTIRLGPVVSITADSGVGSLRYAIAAANAGDTIMFVIPSNSTITLATPLTVSNRLSIAGPGVSASARHSRDKHPDNTYAGITISGNNSQQIFSIQAGAVVTISGLIMTKGSAAVTPGGAVSNAGVLTLVGDVLTANTSTTNSPLSIRAPRANHRAPKHPHAEPSSRRHPHCSDVYVIGGAIYNNSTLIVSSTTFDGNTVTSDKASCIIGAGGAIFNDINGTLLSSGNLYTNNAAFDGGAIYNYAEYGQATFSNDTFQANLGCTDATGCPTSGCSATTCTGYAEGYGAAIYDDYAPGVNVFGCVFKSNVVGGDSPGSYGEGGALYLYEGSPTINNSSFTGNLAGGGSSDESEGYGGAIYWDGSSQGMRINNDTFTGNVAGGDYYGEGGAINAYDPFSGSNDTFTSNVAYGSGSTSYTDGDSEGGAIYQDDGVTLTGSTFTGNVSKGAYEGEGGAVFSDDPATFTGDTFTSNLASADGATGSTSYAYGGAIYNDSGPLNLSNNTFSGNKAKVSGASASEAYGGAIYNDGSYGLSSIHDTFTGNTASAVGGSADVYGGAILNYEPMLLSADTFTNNSATGSYESYGGAIYTDDSTTTIVNTIISGNVASAGYEGYGGGIYDDDGLALGGDTISGNTATHRGGGLYVDDTETVENTTFSGNKVTGGSYEDGGGGIYNDSALTLMNSTLTGNTATVTGLHAGGGGLYSDSTLTMTGTTISGNAMLGSAPAGSGGGGMFSYSTTTILNSTITGNSSNADGGGLLNASSTVSVTNATIFQNKATGTGGNLLNTDVMTLTNSIAAGGIAATGPDVSNSGTLTSGDYNIIQTAVYGTALAGTTTNNLTANPLLLALSNNGGPTFTNADQATSPGKADIPFAAGMCNGVTGTNVDQRGFARGAGGRCDVGAYEFAGVASAVRHQQLPAMPAHRRHPKHHPKPHAPAPPAPR